MSWAGSRRRSGGESSRRATLVLFGSEKGHPGAGAAEAAASSAEIARRAGVAAIISDKSGAAVGSRLESAAIPRRRSGSRKPRLWEPTSGEADPGLRCRPGHQRFPFYLRPIKSSRPAAARTRQGRPCALELSGSSRSLQMPFQAPAFGRQDRRRHEEESSLAREQFISGPPSARGIAL
jgi:hypothetical protein